MMRAVGTACVVVGAVLVLVGGALLAARRGPRSENAVVPFVPTTSTSTTSISTTVVPAGAEDEQAVDPSASLGGVPIPITAVPASTSRVCRADPTAGVYRPKRLLVVNPCMTVSGTVTKLRNEVDGDIHVGLALDPPFKHLLNLDNLTAEGNVLVVEIVPADQQAVPRPAIGEHVAVTGPYVRDGIHGWMEIHPAWGITRA